MTSFTPPRNGPRRRPRPTRGYRSPHYVRGLPAARFVMALHHQRFVPFERDR